MHSRRRFGALALAALLAGCAGGPPPSIVHGPLIAPPMQPATYVERVNKGGIYQPHMQTTSLFSNEKKPRQIGDSVKVDIAEHLRASQKQATDTSRDNKLAVKGPGGSQAGGLLGSILNADARASGNDAFKGSGQTESTSSFAAQLAAAVINVLPNGHLVVAGERSMAFNGGVSTLRFSGVVDPRDIKPGNVVASVDVVNARLEVAGQGDVSEAAQRNWLQRVLTQSLSVW
ncbi:flagellar basal body L-ring protein FlgH [Roseateles sp. DAIF2]|uniref:flagellar basal body L-ring protein FlgH n=1 Tax=Roseateles sp. DAIF2 TaxID=2714952 RepID=UPI0018A310D1|nr:flagellar basal body L-ring protein FlgH [Roseateles sp. DAIF2]QPF75075.1 flagellar basal body L-ring protein FlgH [Roseateles sp. DAIF2]